MTTPINDGGRAGDMTLRDYFAAQAMQALIIRTSKDELDTIGATMMHQIIAIAAHRLADAMIEQRNK